MDSTAIGELASAGATVVVGVLTLVGVFSSNRATRVALEQKVDDLSDRVDRHNRVIERVYALEASQAANEERFKTLFNAVNEEKG